MGRKAEVKRILYNSVLFLAFFLCGNTKISGAAIVKFSSVLLESNTWTAGEYVMPTTVVPPGSDYIKISVDVGSMTSVENKIEINLEISFDGGRNWKNLGVAIFSGGLPGPRAGKPPYISNMEQYLPDSANLNRQIRGFINVRGNPVILNSFLEIR